MIRETVYKRLVELWPKLAIKEHNHGFFDGLRKECCLRFERCMLKIVTIKILILI